MKFFAKSLAFSAFVISGFAQAPASTTTTSQDPNPSARFGTRDASSVFVTGEALFLKPTVENLRSSNTTTASGSSLHYFQNKFKPAVRVAVGYDTSYDGWDLVGVYTGLRYDHTNNLVIATDSGTQQGSQHYKYNFNMADLDLGRMFKVSSKLKVRPHAGIRGVWLIQRASAHYDNLTTPATPYKFTSKINNSLFGLEGGFDSLWMLSNSFSIYANGTLASLYNSAKFRGSDTTTTPSTVTKTGDSTRIILNYDFAIGLRWDKNFSNDDYHFGINVGYEQHNFTNMNSFYTVHYNYINFNQTSTSPMLNVDTDVGFQGVAIGVRFDF